MRKTVSFILGAMLATTTTASQACAILLGIDDRLAMGYQMKTIKAVTLVRITHAKHSSPPTADSHPWQATAAINRVLKGTYAPKSVKFNRGGGSSACDDGHPLPKTGQLWVIYFWQKRDGTLAVWQSYPATKANKYDPQLKGRIL